MSNEIKKAIKGANKGKMSKVTVEEISLAELNKIDSKLNEDVSIKIKPAKAGFKVVFVEGALEAETLSKKDVKTLNKAIKKEKKSATIVLKDTVSLATLNSLLEEFDEIAKVKLTISEGETVLKVKFNYETEDTEEKIIDEELIIVTDSTCTGNCGNCDCEDEDEKKEDDEDENEEVIHLPTENVVQPQPSKKEKKKNKNKKNKKNKNKR